MSDGTRQRIRVRVRRPRWRRWARRSAVVLGALLVLSLLWLVGRGIAAERRLTSARAALQQAEAELLAGRAQAAGLAVTVAREDTDAARRMTSDPVFAVASHVPMLGRPVATAIGLVKAVDAVTSEVLPSLLVAGESVSGGGLLSAPGTVDLGALDRAAPGLRRADSRLEEQVTAVARLASSNGITSIDGARASVLTQLTSLRGVVHSAAVIATVGPPVLGGQGARNYFVAFQNNAEARATGGITGAFGILHADGGRLRFTTIGSDADLHGGLTPIPLPNADFVARYGGSGAGSIWQDVNLTSHFPYAAQTWARLWERQTGQRLDGAFATDPLALSGLLGVTGPAALSNGDVITAATVVPMTMRDSYARFSDVMERKRYFREVARATSARVLSAPRSQSLALFLGLKKAVTQSRLMLWSAHAEEEAQIATTAASGDLPSTRSPVSLLALNNTTGQKVDYYVSTALTYRARTCAGRSRRVQVTVEVHNGAPAVGLPAYVVMRGGRDVTGPPGTSVYLASYYASAGSEVISADLEGRAVGVNAAQERGLAVFGTRLVVPPGQTVTLHLVLLEPIRTGPVATRPQPLVEAQTVMVDAPTC